MAYRRNFYPIVVASRAEVTRSAAHMAANSDFRDQRALDIARKRAALDDPSGILPFGDPITYQNICVD